MANIKKNAQGYNYKYTDLAAVNDYIESIGETYYQEVERIEGDDYIVTVRIDKDGETKIRGCRIILATLSGKNNPAQEAGSGITYARRYSLLMAYGLATEDDDGESMTSDRMTPKERSDSRQEVYVDGLLKKAKAKINETLEAQEYTNPVAKKAFVTKVLGHSTIDNLDEAEEVMTQLENEMTDEVSL